jgi:hypothetical protein
MYVSSRASEASAASPSPHPGGTPGTGKTLGDAEYRDTVLYLQQRQQMNHQEVMAAIRDLAARVTGGGGGGGGGGAMQRSPAPHRGGDYPSPTSDAARSAALGLVDVEGSQVPVGAAYAAMMVSPASAPTFAQVRDTELDAARARIAALEAQVRGLKDQLESKEGTIRRLSEAALREVTSRVGGAGSSYARGSASSSSAAAAQLRQPRAVVQHRDIADFIMSLGGLEADASRAEATSAERDTSVIASTRETLELHDRRCQQLLNATPYSAQTLTAPIRD